MLERMPGDTKADKERDPRYQQRLDKVSNFLRNYRIECFFQSSDELSKED